MSKERRKFTRVNFRIHAAIEYQGIVIGGDVSDLSMQGLFVTTQEEIPLEEQVDVTLRMPGTNPPIEFRLRAVVARVIPEGIGLKICEADIQSFIHLRNIVEIQSDEPENVLEEFLKKS